MSIAVVAWIQGVHQQVRPGNGFLRETRNNNKNLLSRYFSFDLVGSFLNSLLQAVSK